MKLNYTLHLSYAKRPHKDLWAGSHDGGTTATV